MGSEKRRWEGRRIRQVLPFVVALLGPGPHQGLHFSHLPKIGQKKYFSQTHTHTEHEIDLVFSFADLTAPLLTRILRPELARNPCKYSCLLNTC